MAFTVGAEDRQKKTTKPEVGTWGTRVSFYVMKLTTFSFVNAH
uniref:Uncharacterized protein n=1 Tax=Anguilla anguilla TaxID=7936 RepID=A0A0E9R8X2_ANGAN